MARLEAMGHRREDFAVVDTDQTLILRNVEEGDGRRHCTFLVQGRCSVYASRPHGCRTYPFVLDERERLIKDWDCPHREEFEPGARTHAGLRIVLGQVLAEAAARAGPKGAGLPRHAEARAERKRSSL
jgi:Fe-S-cluster containining protein